MPLAIDYISDTFIDYSEINKLLTFKLPSEIRTSGHELLKLTNTEAIM